MSYRPNTLSSTVNDGDGTAREITEHFNAMQGRLRISVTHACQLACKFCHQEGIANHWQPTHIDKSFLVELVNEYSTIGGKFVELTGGEPTIHPKIGELVNAIASPEIFLILCTNGLRLDRLDEQIQSKKIDLIKLSLHATDTANSTKMLLGNAWDFPRLERNVERALLSGTKFQLIFTHTHQNSEFLESVLSLALMWGVDLQVVDLIATRLKQPALELGYMSGDDGEKIVKQYATLERIVKDRTGAVLKLYRTPAGNSWEIKDYHYGVLHSAMCNGCAKRPDCGEGIYALRVDASRTFKPCLLRADLQVNMSSNKDMQHSVTMNKMLKMMLSGDLIWQE
jgi:GTP 3',8-cyclase